METYLKCLLILTLIQISKCTRKAIEPFIVGGNFTNIEKFPHSVYLFAQCDTIWICGASILNQRLLLTAAHCVAECKFSTSNYIEAFIGHENWLQSIIKRNISKVVEHDQYEDELVENDIALAAVDKSIPLGGNAKRVIISPEFSSLEGFVAGWGTTFDSMGASSLVFDLKYIHQKLRSASTCSNIGELHKGMFCAGVLTKAEDHAAQGDSGSALITENFQQIGIVSFHIKEYPAMMVYTNVSYYYPWIALHARPLFCQITMQRN